ncbi:hypothetical protein F3W83_13480, partial [Micrococcus luteus]|nr:hypothetical protein [Micrococcus luteus]
MEPLPTAAGRRRNTRGRPPVPLRDAGRAASDHRPRKRCIMTVTAEREKALLESVPTGLLIDGEWR